MREEDATALRDAARRIGNRLLAGESFTVTLVGVPPDDVEAHVRAGSGVALTPMDELGVLALVEAGAERSIDSMAEAGHEAWTASQLGGER